MKIILLPAILLLLIIPVYPIFADNQDPEMNLYNHASENNNNIEIQPIQINPSVIHVGDTFTITSTLVNNSTVPIMLDGGACVPVSDVTPFFTVTLDNHTKINEKNLTCAGVGLEKILDPRESITGTSPDSTFTYAATEPGTANVTVTFSYHVKNQTDPTQPYSRHIVSKSIQFTILDNNTGSSVKLEKALLSPLQQFESGIKSEDIKCEQGFQLVIKSEDSSPACVKLDTAYMLIKRGWAFSETAYPEGDPQFALYTNSTIIPGHLPRSSGRIPYSESSQVINYTGFVGVYNETLFYRGTQKDYVLEPGKTGAITFEIHAQEQTWPNPFNSPVSAPKFLNMTNYAVFYHEVTSIKVLSKYPGVTISDGGDFKACSAASGGGGACIGGPTEVNGTVKAYVVDHPGVNVLFEPPAEVMPLGTNATTQLVTMTMTADEDAPKGTYLVEIPPVGLDSFLLTVGNQPYHEMFP